MVESGAAARCRVSLIALFGAIALTACGGEEEGEDGAASENTPPALSGSPATSVVVGSEYAFKAEASDPDGDAVLFGIDGLPPWAEFDSLTGTLSGSPGQEDVGTYRGIVVWVTDGDSETLLPPFDIVVSPETPVANEAPTISGTPAATVVAGETYRFVPLASDPDGESLSFTIGNRPPWAAFDAESGKLEGVPPTASAGTYRDVVIAVSDGRATTTLPPFEITVRLPNVNAPPTISGEPAETVAAATEYSFTPTASDVDGDILTFAVENGPSWASFDASTGELAGLPDEADVGTYDGVVITVSDGVESAALGPFSITVTAPSTNTPPTITGSPRRSVLQGQSYAFTPSAFDSDGDALTFSIANKPAWASFETDTGRLDGRPDGDDVGVYRNIVIAVSDGAATASLPAFSIRVEAANSAPTISGTPPTTVAEGAAYSFTPNALDADGDALTFSIQNAPSWAAFEPASGLLSGTPGAGTAGEYDGIVIAVSDGAETAALPAFSITVTAPPNRSPTISGSPPTSANEGVEYVFTPSASDADGDTLTFSIANRPGWLTFSRSTGRLEGTPDAGDVGTHGNIRITVSDGDESDSLPAFSITVAAAPPSNGAPTISGNPPTAVVQGTAYSFTPTADDPDGDTLTFSIANRPQWAGFDPATGRLSGTPDAGDVRTYSNIRISVTDGDASAALPAFSIAVEAIANGTATLSWSAPTERTDGSPLTNLAGFNVYWGPEEGNYPNRATVGLSTLTYVVENLAPGTWYFVTTAFDEDDVESDFSNVASKTIQ